MVLHAVMEDVYRVPSCVTETMTVVIGEMKVQNVKTVKLIGLKRISNYLT